MDSGSGDCAAWSQSCLLDHGACAVTPQAMVMEVTVPRSPRLLRTQ
jgi:uncharacterized protein YcsI (UPF0317 family)